MRAVHPGEILKDELEELGIKPTEFARQIDVPANRVSQLINGKRGVSPDTALRLGHWFGMDPQFWMNLQVQFDLLQADKANGEAIRYLPTRDTKAGAGNQPSTV
jgi:addiction module HigA family antidote